MNDIYKAIGAEQDNELKEVILTKAAKYFKDRGSNNTWDLYPFFAILCSTGTNKNFDHFDPLELWTARNSPVDKPINISHNQKFIVGHMVDSIVVGEDLKPIDENTNKDDLPYKLHIVLAGVIYKIWEDPAMQAEVNQTINKISKGETFVSMEALFRDFAYLLTNASTKERKIIPRNNKTNSLTKYLRQYKGPGKIYDYELARILKDITFSAVGIVDKPANPESIISASLDLFSSDASENEPVYINIEHSTSGEINMSEKAESVKDDDMDNVKCENETLKRDNANLHSLVAELTTKIDETKKKTEKVKSEDEDENAMAELKSTIASLREEVTNLSTNKTELTKANDALNATVDAFKKASRHSERAEAMMKADATLTKEKAMESVKSFDELSDSGFNHMLSMFQGFAERSPKEVTAESVINSAKAEKDVPMGATAEENLTKTVADIKNFLIKTKTKNASAKE